MSVTDSRIDPTSNNGPLFLLGAGFNADARAEVGPVYGKSIYIRTHEVECGYPLVADLARLCFGLTEAPKDRSIEDLFQAAQDAGNPEPIERLSSAIFKADYYLAAGLVPALGAAPNAYSTFFDHFAGSNFLTFNYDSLPELLLLHAGCWFVHDGYGIPVAAGVEPGHEHLLEHPSASLVLHLHGSLCVYTSTFTFEKGPEGPIAWHTTRETPLFLFDPDSIGRLFSSFRALPLTLGHATPEHRVIAPVPSKAREHKREFISSSYARASQLIKSSRSPIVVIGYSFNPLDATSYASLLAAAAEIGRLVVVVSPDANTAASAIAAAYPNLCVRGVPLSFAAWVRSGYAGL